MNRTFSARLGFGGLEPRAVPWAGMSDAVGVLGVLLTLGVFLISCPGSAAPPAAAARLTAICDRTTNEFALADFFKPSEPAQAGLLFTLAPLLLQEVKAGDEAPGSSFGKLVASNDTVSVQGFAPAVYVHTDTLRRDTNVYPRLSYVWFYGRSSSGSAPAGIFAQGIRITLNSSGQPVIWEMMQDGSGLDPVYVSHSLEAAAQAEFGKPLPGRRYCVERSLAEAPDTVVARVVDDGSVAMGPIVYLCAGSRAVSTVICRCMPAQAKALRTTRTYDLLALESASSDSLLARAKAASSGRKAFWPGEAAEPPALEQRLRLPGKF